MTLHDCLEDAGQRPFPEAVLAAIRIAPQASEQEWKRRNWPAHAVGKNHELRLLMALATGDLQKNASLSGLWRNIEYAPKQGRRKAKVFKIGAGIFSVVKNGNLRYPLIANPSAMGITAFASPGYGDSQDWAKI